MEHVTSKDGTIIRYQRSGAGPPLLLVHGTTADHRRWSTILPQFEQRFTVYAMDRRGRGGSTDAPEYDVLREAEDVAAVLESIGEPALVLGHSYGAVCALEGALLTDNVCRMVLYEPPIPTGLPMYAPGVPERMQALIDRSELEAALEVFMREVVRMPEHEFKSYRQLPMWNVRIQLAPTIPRELAIDRAYRFDPEKFADFRVPTLLLLGGDSPPLFRQATEAVDSALPNSTVVTLSGQQHIAMDTDPDQFVRRCCDFCWSKDAAPGPMQYNPLLHADAGLRGLAILLGEEQAQWRWTHGYVENVAAAIALAVTEPQAAGNVYNVGEETTPTEAERVRKLSEVVGWTGEVVELPPENLPDHLQSPFNWQYELATDTAPHTQRLSVLSRNYQRAQPSRMSSSVSSSCTKSKSD